MKYRVGDWVEVLPVEQILATLDEHGCLDGMPFMPEMEKFCGQRFQVHKSAHKGCDTVFPVRSRWIDDAIHLKTRCDGDAHGGCQAGCLLYWKTAWIKPADSAPVGKTKNSDAKPAYSSRVASSDAGGIDRAALSRCTVASRDEAGPIYRCQATQLPYASRDLNWWDFRQYMLDYRSGNAGLWRLICGAVYATFYMVSNLGIGLGRPMRGFYNTFHWVWGGVKYPRNTGEIPTGKPTPTDHLDLQPGEFVRVKPHDEILKTLNVDSKNRGMGWDAEFVPYCGNSYKVLRRVSKIVDEKSGRIIEMKNPCIILDGVVCKARYSHCRMLCPREIYPYWREIWLERIESSK